MTVARHPDSDRPPRSHVAITFDDIETNDIIVARLPSAHHIIGRVNVQRLTQMVAIVTQADRQLRGGAAVPGQCDRRRRRRRAVNAMRAYQTVCLLQSDATCSPVPTGTR